MGRSRKVDSRKRKLLYCYTAAVAALSLSIFLMPIAYQFRRQTRIPMYIVGAAFWLMLLAIIGFAVWINAARRRSQAFNSQYKRLKKLALVHFFQNKKAQIIDIMMFASLIGFVATYFLIENSIVQFFFISMFVFSFGMHCMLNGINYIYIQHKQS